jgi:hypothetical protein
MLLLAGLTGLALAGCSHSVEAPTDPGVCWHMVQDKAGQYRFNKVADHVQNVEYCAAQLERMRIHFLALGGTNREVVGAYQGQFIFVQKEGIMSADKLDGIPYTLLVRSGDGRLVNPSAMPTAP